MLNRIRNLSSSPVILIMFGMLILVFILFFGMPSMGISAGGTVYYVPSKVFNAEVKLNEAHAYVKRFRLDSDDGFNQMRKRFKQVQEVIMLDEVAKDTMGWESTNEQVEEYMTQGSNLDHYLFGKVEIELEDLNDAFTKSMKDDGDKAKNLSGRELAQNYLEFSRKARGFSAKTMKDALESWGLDAEEYLEIKGRELRVRSYLNFLKSQIKVSQASIEDQITQDQLKWTFDYALLGTTHVDAPADANDQEAEEYIKTHEGAIASYYENHILDYSKSKLAFTRVSINYQEESKAKAARAKIDEAFTKIKAGADPTEVGAQLSEDGLKLNVYAQGNKNRKNTDPELFEKALKMDEKQLLEVQTPKNTKSYYFIRLDKKESGDEKKLEVVKSEIAKILIKNERQLELAKTVANDIRTQVISGTTLSAAIDAYNGKRAEGSKLEAVTLAESGDVSLAGLVSNRIGNIGNHPVAAQQLLDEIININADHKAPMVMKIKDQWAVLSLKARTEATLADHIDRATSVVQNEAQREFLGRTWNNFILTGEHEPILIRLMPMEVLIKLAGEMLQGEGFIDEIIKTEYSKHVEEAPEVTRFLAGRNQD